ncbi:MAG: endopeptidase La [Desulfosarcina sp.]|nr:endopeptidase La [Desulfosarcina sp.]MBC2767820.1 endopeptidase La [Desulfosarcina sp.]
MVNIPKFFKNQEMEASREVLPLLPLRDIVVFPHMVAPLFVGRNKSVSALSSAMTKDKRIFLATQRNAGVDNPTEKDICDVGVIGTVLQLLRLPDGTVKALIEGKQRARIERYVPNPEFFEVELSLLPDIPGNTIEMEALMRGVIDGFSKYASINKSISKDLLSKVSAIPDPSKLADSVASHFSFKLENKQNLLETADLRKRLSLLVKLIKLEIEVHQMDQRIKGRVKEQMEKTQKNYYLNEQMRAIKKEMGAEDETGDELKDLEKKIKRKRMSKEASVKARQEFKKLKLMTPMSAEATVVRNYIDWMISLPWYKRSPIRHDLIEAEKILNEDHYGLEKPSLAQSVARATGRKFVRLSLGGVRDEAEIRGHRRTYIGAMPGKIIQSLKKAGVNNPVFCLDEVDKMSMDFRGDPSSALLEVLDPEQNYSFNDHYLDLDYDLSDILFITTANTLPDIPLPLQDRMEIIRLPGYTELEKYNIAKEFLVSKQIAANGLKDEDISFSKSAIYTIIQRYTREAGVRNLEREISSICRKTARKVVNRKDEKKYVISVNTITKLLGPPPFKISQIEETDQVGLVTGLAWTQVGGELLYVEALTMPGKGKLNITGKLGDVMKESAQAAVSFVRSRAENLGIDKDFYKDLDLHIHIPEGAIPKDGPSAGISMCTSLVSALTRRPVRRDVAMTGEITLRGRVLPIGGLKEKMLAAHRGGIRKVIIPIENEKDLKDIPKVVTRQMKVVTVEHMDEVLGHALVLGQGERLFANNDMPIPVEKGGSDQHQISIN